jgi:predicted transposase/invertase (TIGR01784 family)
MKARTLISFDWAIKKVLRHKDNFGVLEGFLSELLGFDLTIQNLLESESNQQSEKDKFNRVDILVKSNKGELMLIEVQYDDQIDYFHRMVYGMSKLISEYISEKQKYGAIKKAYSINIVYFRLGQGKDYVYEYKGAFMGRHTKDTLQPTSKQKLKYGIKTVADIFPKYLVIRVGNFKKEENITDPLDEWVYFLKNSEIKDSFKAKGMKEAKVALNYENMPEDDKFAYKRFVENRRNAMSSLDTALEKGIRLGQIKTAKALLELHMDPNHISIATQLTFDEIERLAKGEDIDKEEDEDDWNGGVNYSAL